MIQLDLSILNQKGTPMFNSDIFANRPTFGIVGRIFISTDTSQIFRDTGTSYVLISDTSAGGTISGSGTTGTLPLWSGSNSIGNSLITQSGTNITVSAKTFVSNTFTAISLLNPLALSVGTNNTFDAGITWPSLEPCDNVEFLQNNNYNGNITYLNSNYTANHLILSGFQFLSASTTITSNQTTGIRALSNQILQARINGTNNGTITHFANSLVYGDFAASTARFNFTNRYGYLVNNLDEYGAGHTYTNRYAFYNQGASDHNHFAGKMLLNTLTVTSNQLSVVGTTLLNGALSGTSASFSGDIRTQNGTTYTDLKANATSGLFLNALIPATFDLYFYMNRNTVYGGNGVSLSSTNTGTGNISSFHNLNVQDFWSRSVNTRDIIIATLGGTSGDNKFLTYNLDDASNSDGAIRFRVAGWGNSAIMGITTRTGRNRNDFDFRVGYAAADLNTGTLAYRINGDSGNFIIGSVGTNVASAILNVDSTTKGFLSPRMTTTQKNAIVTPAAGLIVYDSTLNKLCVRTAAAWETITSI